uniref:Uncharacterized protein n=1 Tax=Wuchereria bancrofti TaxID=6293 RepID=A0A1I8F141_WUCBA
MYKLMLHEKLDFCSKFAFKVFSKVPPKAERHNGNVRATRSEQQSSATSPGWLLSLFSLCFQPTTPTIAACVAQIPDQNDHYHLETIKLVPSAVSSGINAGIVATCYGFMPHNLNGRYIRSLHLTDYKFEIDSFAQYYGSLVNGKVLLLWMESFAFPALST